MHIFNVSANRQTQAADIRIDGLTVREMYELASEIEDFGGIGVYPLEGDRFIHVDVRKRKPDGTRALWGRIGKDYVGIDMALADPGMDESILIT